MPTQSNDAVDATTTPRAVAQRTVNRPVPAAESTPRSFRPATMQRCPNCGERNHSHASICATCGENLRVKPQKIRCRHCNHRASSILIVCPHCGRELQAAPVRWLFWLAPALLVLLFLAVFVTQGSLLRPLQWAQTQVQAGIDWVQQLGERMDPQFTVEDASSDAIPNPVPIAQDNGNNNQTAATAANEGEPSVVQVSLVATATETVDTPTAVPPTATSTDTPSPEPTATSTATTMPTATTTNTPAPTDTPAPSPTATATRLRTVLLPTPTVGITVTLAPLRLIVSSTQTALLASSAVTATQRATVTRQSLLPTNTPALIPTNTATNTPPPTATPTALILPTPTPLPRTYTILSGDTLSEIADSFNITVDELMATNNLSQNDVYALRPGDVLEIPGVAAAPLIAATNTPPPTATTPPRTYTLQSGDTPGDIAERFGISTDDLLAANGLTREDARRLRTGQVLIIPGAGTPANSSPAAEVSRAPAAPVPSGARLNAPQLRSPENGSQLSCNGSDKLIWLPVDFILAEDLYMLHLGFVNGVAADGSDNIVWVLEQPQAPNNTLWNPDPGLCGLAPQEFGRKWYWYVEVVDGKTRVPVSPPSPFWSFRWN